MTEDSKTTSDSKTDEGEISQQAAHGFAPAEPDPGFDGEKISQQMAAEMIGDGPKLLDSTVETFDPVVETFAPAAPEAAPDTQTAKARLTCGYRGCEESFATTHGLAVHKSRMHTAKGKAWGKKTAQANRETAAKKRATAKGKKSVKTSAAAKAKVWGKKTASERFKIKRVAVKTHAAQPDKKTASERFKIKHVAVKTHAVQPVIEQYADELVRAVCDDLLTAIRRR